MDITASKDGQTHVLKLEGRLDASWCANLEAALSSAIRNGEHHIALHMAGVNYISSAGLRVFVIFHRQLKGIKGALSLRDPSPEVVQILKLSGLSSLLVVEASSTEAVYVSESRETPSALWQIHPLTPSLPASLTCVSSGESIRFEESTFGLGHGAFAATAEEAVPLLGEFVAVAGCAAQLPASSSSRPDYMMIEEELVPSAWLADGLSGQAGFTRFCRFDAKPECRAVPLAEVAGFLLETSDSSTAIAVIVTEATGFVGASLRRSATDKSGTDPFTFPAIRDHLTFTSERSFRDSTAVIVGVVGQPDSPVAASLRPIDGKGELYGHFHAAIFPYRPLRKGRIDLKETIRGLFEAQGLQSVLHLINDIREPAGAGDSLLARGACWLAPLTKETQAELRP